MSATVPDDGPSTKCKPKRDSRQLQSPLYSLRSSKLVGVSTSLGLVRGPKSNHLQLAMASFIHAAIGAEGSTDLALVNRSAVLAASLGSDDDDVHCTTTSVGHIGNRTLVGLGGRSGWTPGLYYSIQHNDYG
jgi:hypothetical protein